MTSATATATTTPTTFQEFEYEGWADDGVCRNYDDHFGAVTIQSIGALLDAAAVREAGRVLDVCTGAGYGAGLAAERGARATGLDFSESQVALAQAHYPGVEFQQGDATELPFGEGTFDSVINSIGVPHFEDPDAAIREAFRVLRRGGRFAFTVYDSPERTVGFGAIYHAVQNCGSMELGLPAGPNFFLFSDPTEAARRLEAAGFESVSSTIVPQTWHLQSAEELFDAVANGSVRAAATLRAQTPRALKAIKSEVITTIENYRTEGGYKLPMPAVLIAARKPLGGI